MRNQRDDDDDGVPRGTQGSDVPEDPKVDMAAGDDDDEPDNMPEEEEEEPEEGIQGLTAKTIFLGATGEENIFPAGDWIDTILAFDNADDTAAYTVRFVASHINQIGDANAYVQNFTGNTFERAIESKSTGTFKYRFKPHESLNAQDYNLVIRVFFSTSNNETLAIAAYNSTISITEPTGTDPEMIMTFVTIAALIGAAVWFFQNKQSKKPRYTATASASASTQEMGSKGSLNKDYISEDHLRFAQAQKDRNQASQSPKRSGSGKKK